MMSKNKISITSTLKKLQVYVIGTGQEGDSAGATTVKGWVSKEWKGKREKGDSEKKQKREQ